MTFRTLRSTTFALVFSLTAATVPAQTQTQPAGSQTGNAAVQNTIPQPSMLPAAAAQEMLGVVLAAEYEHLFSSNLKSGATGKMSVNRTTAGFRLGHNWERQHATFGAAYTYNNYDFSGISPSPFSNVQQFGMSLFYSYDIDEQWGVFGRLGGGFAAETATTLTRGELFSAAIGPTFRWDENLSFYVGPMFYTRLEDSNSVAFAGNLDWKIAPHWSLNLFAGREYGATIAYDVFEDYQTVVEGTVQYESNWFRTRNVGGGKQAVNETGTTARVGVTQRFLKAGFVRVYVEGIFSRTYQFHFNGHSSNSFNVDAGAGVGFQLGANF